MNNEQSEVSRHPHHPSGCGWVIVAAVFLFVLVVTGAGIYHEINFHPDPVNLATDTLRNEIDSAIDDSTLEDHSRIPDTFSQASPEIQRAYDSSVKARRDSL